MRPTLQALLLAAAFALTACGGGSSQDDEGFRSQPDKRAAEGNFSDEVRDNFLSACVENAVETANGAATEEQLTSTCECILGKVEEEYSQEEFEEFEKRLVAGDASDQESGRLINWSTQCAQDSAS